MNCIALIMSFLISTTAVTITEPVDGETYDGDWLPLRAIVENENEIPDSVHYNLNGQTAVLIPRLNTDWYTYMQNDLHNGFSESPAPMENTILWTAPILGTLHEFPTPVVVDGIVYHPQDGAGGGYGDTLFALDAVTGETEWIFTGTGPTDDAVTVKNGRLYIACDSVYCLDALTGEMIWVFGDADKSGSTPAVSDGKVYCARMGYSTGSQIYCLDADNGEEIWSSEVPGTTVSCMTVWQDMLFIPTDKGGLFDGLFFALDISNGEIVWANDDPPGEYWDSSPNVVDGIIYIGGSDGYLRAIDAVTGETIWLSNFGLGEFITATPAYYSGSVFIGSDSDSGPFASVDAVTGVFNWMQEYEIHGSPAVADGMVFFGEDSDNDSARVISLDCITGDTVWTYMTTANSYQGSPAIVDGVLYIPATDGNLYAFGTGLKYTYREDYFYADVGSNELIVTSFDGGTTVAADTINFTVTQTGITLEPSSRLALCANPNPFYSDASISFELSEPGWTSVTVYDLSGRIVRTLENSELGTGQHSIVWDGRRENGEIVSAGLYLCRIQSGGISETTGMCLLR
ncbi:MAG: PQQ-binding-like beta-propeller repeat protein [Candidatus Aegiribacteria sp.]|nr:PQQ-binding-like beta-propeller repeat protein [Candidatus Aegiribacteria sp.]